MFQTTNQLSSCSSENFQPIPGCWSPSDHIPTGAVTTVTTHPAAVPSLGRTKCVELRSLRPPLEARYHRYLGPAGGPSFIGGL